MSKNKKQKNPRLYKESYIEEEGDKQNRPPYIFLGLIIFVIISFFWKSFVSSGSRSDDKISSVVPDHHAADSVDMKR